MHLVEAEAVGPVEGDDPIITPPRPPHRRVSVSFLFTISAPRRHGDRDLPASAAAARRPRHRSDRAPSHIRARGTSTRRRLPELHAWAIGVAGKDVPLPAATTKVLGARRIDILKRGAAVIRLQLGGDQVTYLVQHARGISRDHVVRDEGDLHAEAWRRGSLTVVTVGPAATPEDVGPVTPAVASNTRRRHR